MSTLPNALLPKTTADAVIVFDLEALMAPYSAVDPFTMLQSQVKLARTRYAEDVEAMIQRHTDRFRAVIDGIVL